MRRTTKEEKRQRNTSYLIESRPRTKEKIEREPIEVEQNR